MGWLPALGHWSQSKFKHLFFGFLLGFAFSVTSTSFSSYLKSRKRRQVEKFESRPIELRSDEIVSGVTGLIGTNASFLHKQKLTRCQGNTPLVRINSLSDALGVEILGKAEARPAL